MNTPGKKIRKIRNKGISSKERARRIQLLIDCGAIKSASEIPETSIPIDSDIVAFGWSGITKLYYSDYPFTCVDCDVPQVWFKEDQMWYYEEVRGPIDQIAVRCRDCRF